MSDADDQQDAEPEQDAQEDSGAAEQPPVDAGIDDGSAPDDAAVDTISSLEGESPVEEPPADGLPVTEPSSEDPSLEEPPVEEPPVEDPAVEEPPVEDPAVEEPTVEELTAEGPTSADAEQEPPPAEETGAAAAATPVADAFLAVEDEQMARRGSAEVKAIVEALIFASPDPLTFKALTKLLSGEPKEDVQAAIAELKQDYERPGGLQLVEVAGGYQIVTRSDLHEWVRRLFHERSTQKLSVQALETLAVVAYRQPVTALEITEIRGVNTSGVMNTLLERHLIKIVGRKQVVGRPFMYATTKEFLIRFGLNDLTDLPKVEDMAEALGIDSPLLVERLPAEEQLPLEEPPDDGDEGPADDDPSGSSNGSIH